jgi:hypothetical protein
LVFLSFNPERLAAFFAAFFPSAVYGYFFFPTLGMLVVVVVVIVKNYQHFHRLSARAFRVGRPLVSFIGPLTPDIRAQKDRFLGPPFGCGLLRLLPVFWL